MIIKALATAATAAVLGVAIGSGVAWTQLSGVRESFDAVREQALVPKKLDLSRTVAAQAPAIGEPAPTLTFPDGKDHEFGVMEANTERSFDFIVKNEGDAPLALEVGQTTCKCTISGLEKNSLAPGESTGVKLTWKPLVRDLVFRQEATLISNDPTQPVVKLVIRGRVQTPVWLDPASVTFSGLEATSEAERTIEVLASADPNLVVEAITFERPDTASYFQITHGETLPGGMGADKEPAESHVELKLTVKPGLPLGPFEQLVTIKTSTVKEPLTLELKGTIVGPINMVGKGYKRSIDSLVLGRILTTEGLNNPLQLILKGDHRNDTTFTLDQSRSVPSGVFDVSFGTPVDLSNGTARMIPLNLTVAKGTQPMSYRGEESGQSRGQLVFKTTHPDYPELIVPVYFEVAEPAR